MKTNKKTKKNTKITNKLAAVDAAFVASSKDVAEAIEKVGLSARNARANLNRLIKSVKKNKNERRKR